jgi:hypothetical protein
MGGWTGAAPAGGCKLLRSDVTTVTVRTVLHVTWYGNGSIGRQWAGRVGQSVPAAWGQVGRRYVWTDGRAYAYRQRKMREIRTRSPVG